MGLDACPKCHVRLVQPSGPKKSPILLVGDQPGWKEKALARPLVGETGELLEAELRRLGIELHGSMRLTNLWLHDPIDEEVDWHLGQLLKEIKGRKLVLLMGSKVVNLLVGKPVTTVSGLVVKSKLVDDPKTTLMACYNPAIVFKEGEIVGELRLALEKFAKRYQEIMG